MRLCPSCEIAYPDDHQLCPRDGATLPGARPVLSPLLGAVVAQRYRVLQCLAVGRTASVYRVQHEPLARELVLKLASAETMANPEQVKRFLLQARAASAMRSVGVMVVDFGFLRDHTCYLVTETCSGVPLSTVLAKGPLPLPRALAITAALAQILDKAHGLGFIYADLCAEEVFLGSGPTAGSKPTDEVRLIDWGGAYALADSPRWPADARDWPRVCPPEAAPGAPVTPQADQYQLAALTHQMLSGQSGEKTLTDRFLPVGLVAVLARALGRKPEERYPSINEFAEALGRALPAALASSLGGDPPLRYCPLCGNASVDTEGYGGSGSGRCTRCGTIFSVLASPARWPAT